MRKIISIILVFIFSFQSIAFSAPVQKHTLRPPLATSKTAKDFFKLSEGKTEVHVYDPGKGGLVVYKLGKDALQERIERDEVGLVELDGEEIWLSKHEGAFILENGDLLLSPETRFPNEQDAPIGRLDLPRYVKIVPLAYNFFRSYLGKGEFQYFADHLEKTRVVLVSSRRLGNRHYQVDKETNTVYIELPFMEYLLQLGLKRVTMGIFAQTLTELYLREKDTPANGLFAQNKIINRIAQVSIPTGNHNRLEDAIKLFNLKDKVMREVCFLAPKEKKFWLIDQMERTRSFNGRRAADALEREFGKFGETSHDEAENMLKEIKNAYPYIIAVDKYQVSPEDEDMTDKFKDRTDTYHMEGQYLADVALIKDRSIVWDYEVGARDAPLFGGKTAYTGMMQHTPGAITLAAFATSGKAFKEKLIGVNPQYDATFTRLAADLKKDMESLFSSVKESLATRKGVSKSDIKDKEVMDDSEFTKRYLTLIRSYSNRYKELLAPDKADIAQDLVEEIRESLKHLAERLDIPLRLLILAIRSSALGEDSEAASFAGRQDTSLFVMILDTMRLLRNKGIDIYALQHRIRDEEDSWKQLRMLVDAMKEAGIPVEIDESRWGISVKSWNIVLQALIQELVRQDEELGAVKDEDLDIFVKEWLANQRSLFNFRSIDYRLQQTPPLPIYSEDVEMSSLFQQMGFFDIGIVGFGVNRNTGVRQLEMGLVEGATNTIVANKSTPDNAYVRFKGELVDYKISDNRRTWEVPNVLGLKRLVEGEEKKGGTIELEFPKELEGKPVTTDNDLLGDLGIVGRTMYEYYRMYQDFEGGLKIRRDSHSRPIYVKDSSQPDGIARDHAGNPRYEYVFIYTQVRPETRQNLRDSSVVFLRYMDMSEKDISDLREKGLVLYEEPTFHSRGAAAGPVQWTFKDRSDEWHKVHGKIMVTEEGTPDMDAAMHRAGAIIALVGGRQSHTAIMSMEFGWVVVTGLPDLNLLYNGRKVTVVASQGIIFEGDHSDRLKPVGEDFNARELPILPEGFKLGLNVNALTTAQNALPLGGIWPSFYGSGLVREEQLLGAIGAAPEGLLQYDNYRYKTLLTKMDQEGLTDAERSWLTNALLFHGNISRFHPSVLKDRIVITENGQKEEFSSGSDFYIRYIEDNDHPAYDPTKDKEAKLIEFFDKLTSGYLSGEERYVDILSRGLEGIAETFRVWPKVFMELAQGISDPGLQKEAIELANLYESAYMNSHDAPEDPHYYLDKLSELRKKAKDEDKVYLSLLIEHMDKAIYIRLDDRKSDELEKMPGSRVVRDLNPMAGYRGIRMMLDDKRVLRMQLEAIKNLVDKRRYLVRVFAPVVYDEEQFIELKKVVEDVGLDLERVKLGIMTETPQAFELRPFLELINFSSTGGNDQLQFSKAVDRMMMGAPYFDTLTNRAKSLIRMLATLANETKRHNKSLKDPSKKVTAGYCGDWPSADLVGAIILYVLGYDSASLTLPRVEGTARNIWILFDHIYGHYDIAGHQFLQLPRDKNSEVDREQIALDIIRMADSPAEHKGLSEELIKVLPALKTALQERHYNIYDEIDPGAAPEIRSDYNAVSVSQLHSDLPMHYRLLLDYDEGGLDVSQSLDELAKIYSEKQEDKLNLQDEFDGLVERSQEGEEISADLMDEKAGKLNSMNNEISDVEWDMESIKLKRMVEEFLEKKGYLVQKGQGRAYYIDALLDLMRHPAKEALKNNESFFLESANETSDLLKSKPGVHRYELKKEGNPAMGNRGMKKNLNPDKEIFKWDLTALKTLRKELKGLFGYYTGRIGLTLRTVREVQEVKDTTILLSELGIEEGDIDLALAVDVPDIQYYFDDFLEGDFDYGINALVMSAGMQRQLAQFKRGTEWDNRNVKKLRLKPLITDKDVRKSLKDVTLPVAMTAADKYKVPLYIPTDAPLTALASNQKLVQVEDELLSRITELLASRAESRAEEIKKVASKLAQLIKSAPVNKSSAVNVIMELARMYEETGDVTYVVSPISQKVFSRDSMYFLDLINTEFTITLLLLHKDKIIETASRLRDRAPFTARFFLQVLVQKYYEPYQRESIFNFVLKPLESVDYEWSSFFHNFISNSRFRFEIDKVMLKNIPDVKGKKQYLDERSGKRIEMLRMASRLAFVHAALVFLHSFDDENMANKFLTGANKELSTLNRHLFSNAYKQAYSYLETMYGEPRLNSDSSKKCRAALWLGGSDARKEFPSFDYDVLGMYEEKGKTSGGFGGKITNSEFFNLLLNRMDTITENIGHRLDQEFGLPSEGQDLKQGPLVKGMASVSEFQIFFNRAKENTLYLSNYLNIVFAAGDAGFGEARRDWIYGKEFSKDIRKRSIALHIYKILKQREYWSGKKNIKYSGLREVLFAKVLLSISNGESYKDTSEALGAMESAGYLSTEEIKAFYEDYSMLLRWRIYMDLCFGRNEKYLPTGKSLQLFLKNLGYANVSDFESDFNAIVNRLQASVDDIIDGLKKEDPEIAQMLKRVDKDLRISEAQAEEKKEELARDFEEMRQGWIMRVAKISLSMNQITRETWAEKAVDGIITRSTSVETADKKVNDLIDNTLRQRKQSLEKQRTGI